jgi:xylose isomerase
MHWNYAANAAFFGGRRDRFTQYRPDRSLEEKIAVISDVKAVSGVELKYPRDFTEPERTLRLIEDAGLALSAVNLDIKDARWFREGALSASDPAARRQAVGLAREAMDLAAEADCVPVTTCPVMDGHDYAFEKDHRLAWENLIATVAEIVSHRDDVDLLLEYQPRDPVAHIMIGNVGAAIEVCLSVGAGNLGVNLDVGHAFAAGENPAESAARLSRHGLLRYLHSNDNPGDGGDWDMISGSVHLFDWLELLWTLKHLPYEGWISGDISPRAFEADAAYGANATMIECMTDAVLSVYDGKPEPTRVPDILSALAHRLGGNAT